MTEPTKLTPRQVRQAYKRAYRETNKVKIQAKYEENKDLHKAAKAAWRENNADTIADKSREYYEANKDRCIANMRAYHKANKEYEKEKGQEWNESHPEYSRNKRAAPGIITPGWVPKLLELQRWTCVVCNVDLRFGYHIDHVQPIARGGENTDYNLQALCPTCNMQKSDKDPIDFMQSRGFLL